MVFFILNSVLVVRFSALWLPLLKMMCLLRALIWNSGYLCFANILIHDRVQPVVCMTVFRLWSA